MSPQIEFRIPISPTPDFYERVHLFCAALRRLETASSKNLVSIVVGDGADLSRTRRDNFWAEQYEVKWYRVPDEIFAAYSYHGTADFRYLLPDRGADLVILVDADTVLLKPIDQDFLWMFCDQPCIAGHMAHLPAPFVPTAYSSLQPNDLWPFLFREFSITWPERLYEYSLKSDGEVPPAPAYYNLGFIVLNQPAVRIFRENIFPVQDKLRTLIDSYMSCQIAVTLISYLHATRRTNLPAIFNAANDLAHLNHNRIQPDQIKVIHYLRTDEIDKHAFLTDQRSAFFNSTLRNPVNKLLQKLVRELLDERGGD